jgi:hypothetical protein
MNKKGLTYWEIGLFAVFLGVAFGASVFFFVLSSRDVRDAQQKYSWVKDINETLDLISLEIANAIIIEFPFSGTSKELYYKGAMNSASLIPTGLKEGFIFSENSLNFSSGISVSAGLGRMKKSANPLISNCRDGKFIRMGPDRIDLSVRVFSPDNSEEYKTFYRVIHLRNK